MIASRRIMLGERLTDGNEPASIVSPTTAAMPEELRHGGRGGSMRLGVKRAVLVLGVLTVIAVRPSTADTLNGALVEAYVNNPQLGAQRSATRATDENVPIQLGGYRPRLTATN